MITSFDGLVCLGSSRTLSHPHTHTHTQTSTRSSTSLSLYLIHFILNVEPPISTTALGRPRPHRYFLRFSFCSLILPTISFTEEEKMDKELRFSFFLPPLFKPEKHFLNWQIDWETMSGPFLFLFLLWLGSFPLDISRIESPIPFLIERKIKVTIDEKLSPTGTTPIASLKLFDTVPPLSFFIYFFKS